MILLGTNDIRGITACPSALNDNTYTISCDYVSGCNLSGCSYNLTSMIDIPITGNIEGSNVNIIESNKVSQKTFQLTVRDLNEVIVQSNSITFNDNICPTTTGQVFNHYPYIYIRKYIFIAATTITSERPSESGSPSLSGGAITAIAVVVPAAIVLVVAIIITFCLIKLGEISVFFTGSVIINVCYALRILLLLWNYYLRKKAAVRLKRICDNILYYFLLH